MEKPCADTPVVALIGDLVSSRRLPDRVAVQRRLVAVLAEVEQQVPSVQLLDVTLGDEFQGAYATLAEAALAALLVRLTLLPEVDTRYGLGRGGVTVFDAGRDPVSQDGPGWWSAREAIGAVERLGASPRSRSARTWFSDARDPAAAAAVNAFLTCRDDIVARMSPRARRLLRGLLLGQQQTAMAQAEGISQSAVSQSLSGSGAYAVLRAHEQLRDAG